ncbi:30S ribosomal protein S26e [Candidatus Bathyarchaeota archaeon]|nr:30S ribosomal protein S26e [Candidatus Bathyarchaeota archaeon]
MKKLSSGITRKKGQSGRTRSVECTMCGAMVPRDKAISKTRRSLPLDRNTRRLLKEAGARIHSSSHRVYYCVSCAKHRKYV